MSLQKTRRTWARFLRNSRYDSRIPHAVERILSGIAYLIDSRKRKDFVMDVVGSCNLRCPSCPVGNMGPVNPTGLVDIELFARLIEKASRDYYIDQVWLFNWAEPLLHPELPELIRIVKRQGLPCAISSNLNILRNVDAILEAEPNWWRISLSGFNQESYAQTHSGGNIDRVKENMRKLSEACGRMHGRRPIIQVSFHKYLHNLRDVEPMRALAVELGFQFEDVWAFYMPLEKVLALTEGQLPDEERSFVENQFALPIVDAVDVARKFRHEPCRVLDQQIALDLQGNLLPCCAVYDFKNNRLGAFLDMSPADFERAKSGIATCDRCATHGLHRYFEYFSHAELSVAYDRLARDNLARSRSGESVPSSGTLESSA